MNYNIYALIDPRDNNVFYIGATRKTLHERLCHHLSALGRRSKKNSPSDERKETISKIVKSGLSVIIKLLEVTNSAKVRELEESYYWKYFYLGHKLLQSPNHFTYCQYHYLFNKIPGKTLSIPMEINLFKILKRQPEMKLGIPRNKVLCILVTEALDAREAKKNKKCQG